MDLAVGVQRAEGVAFDHEARAAPGVDAATPADRPEEEAGDEGQGVPDREAGEAAEAERKKKSRAKADELEEMLGKWREAEEKRSAHRRR